MDSFSGRESVSAHLLKPGFMAGLAEQNVPHLIIFVCANSSADEINHFSILKRAGDRSCAETSGKIIAIIGLVETLGY